MKRGIISVVCLMFFALPGNSYGDAHGQDTGVVGKVGLGLSGNFNFPVFGMSDRFRAQEAFGLYFTYARDARNTLEVEYHRTRFDPGKIQEATFYWPEDKPEEWQRITSPLARNYMTVNAFTINGLYHLKARTGGSDGVVGSPFIAYGGGFYHYKNSVSGLIFAGQPNLGGGIDTTLELAPFDDTDVAWGLNVGLGIEVLASGRAAVDARARWNLLIGELRQLESYGVARTFPLHYFEIGLSVKYYVM